MTGLFSLGFIFIFLIILGVCLIPLIFYLITIQDTLKEISPENRQMQPGEVWLSIIPLFGMVWQFFVVDRVSKSLKAEFLKRNIQIVEEKPGYSIGIAFCILNCCGIIPVLGGFAGIGGLVCWIIYWIKIADYKTLLINNRIPA